MIVENGKYYLYRHIREDKDEPFYIGIGTKKNPDKNWKSNYERANTLNHTHNRIWKGIVNKTNYEVEILLESNNELFIEQKEIEFIKLYGRINKKTGILANLTDGGKKGIRGMVMTKQTKKNMSLARKGKPSPNKGIPVTEEMKIRISNTLMGSILDPKSIKKRTKTRKQIADKRGYYWTEDQKKALGNGKKKVLYQYDLEGNFLAEFESLHAAEKIIGISFQMLAYACKKELKEYKGYKFTYNKI